MKKFGGETGIGLSICADIIAEHGGEIKVESKEGEFTRVVVELPAIAPPRPN
ncbi:MAG: HAMP domain-containing histidine kinase [Nitrospinae bacterium]|nr:HAMP domain-containing histidine kinase [Nitrospinota bacterium]